MPSRPDAEAPTRPKEGFRAQDLRRVALEVGMLVFAAAALAAVSNALAGSERRLEWGRPAVSPQPAPGASPLARPRPASDTASPGPWTEISTEEAERLYRSGVLFLDARRTAEYRLGHVAGARSVPVWEAGLDDKVKALFAERTDQSAPIVVYCNGGECEDSHDLAQKLYLAGFDAVRVYRDGFPDWARRHLPSARGELP